MNSSYFYSLRVPYYRAQRAPETTSLKESQETESLTFLRLAQNE